MLGDSRPQHNFSIEKIRSIRLSFWCHLTLISPPRCSFYWSFWKLVYHDRSIRHTAATSRAAKNSSTFHSTHQLVLYLKTHKNRLKCVKSNFLCLALIWLVKKLDNSFILVEAKLPRATSSYVCKIELLFVTRDVVARDVFAVCLFGRWHSRAKWTMLQQFDRSALYGEKSATHWAAEII